MKSAEPRPIDTNIDNLSKLERYLTDCQIRSIRLQTLQTGALSVRCASWKEAFSPG